MIEMVSQLKNTGMKPLQEHGKILSIFRLMSTNQEPCRIVRRADQQGTRPSIVCQAEVEKYATGCDGLLPSTTTPGYKNSLVTGPNREDTSTKGRTRKKNIRIPTINIRTLQDDIKLATVIKATSKLGIDVLAMQESIHLVGLSHSKMNQSKDGNLSGVDTSVNMSMV